ncbi:MAG: hypothetical protein HRU70_08090 [Phycisphaeraceae bacterium]|nr:MAG: hypothetical protein HRU70_08090 [Phycisphaeraceae bacterium]
MSHRRSAAVLFLSLIVPVAFAAQPAERPRRDPPPPADRPDQAPAREPGREQPVRTRDAARPREARPGEPGVSRPPVTREDLRARLERRAEQIEREREALAALRQRLDRGEEPDAIVRDMGRSTGGPPFREEWRDRPQPGQPGPEDRRRLTEFLREHAPDLHQRIERLNTTQPPITERLLARMGPRPTELVQLKESNPALYALKLRELDNAVAIVEQARALGQAWAAGTQDGPDATQARRLLRQAIEKQVDVRSEIQALDIAELEKRLADLREEFRLRRQDRASAIERWADDMGKMAEMIGRLIKEGPRDGADRPRPDAPAPDPARPGSREPR